MSKIAVVYWSGTGHTEAMADAVADGAKGASAGVSVFTAHDFKPEMVDDYDAIAFGCPSMGAEQLEEGEFEPMFSSCESKLKGKRLALPNSEIMIHQPLGGAQGQATEIQIAADHILKTRQKLNQILAENTGQPLEVINADTERDNFMTAEEAKAYGLIDEVIKSR